MAIRILGFFSPYDVYGDHNRNTVPFALYDGPASIALLIPSSLVGGTEGGRTGTGTGGRFLPYDSATVPTPRIANPAGILDLSVPGRFSTSP